MSKIFFFSLLFFISSCSRNPLENFPGNKSDHYLLPNGWRLTPAGKNIETGEFPMNMVISENEKYAFVSNSGTAENSISVIDIKNELEIDRKILKKTWRGLAYDNRKNLLYVSGGNDNLIYIFKFYKNKLQEFDTIKITPLKEKSQISIAGLAISQSKELLLATSKEENSLFVIDINNNSLKKRIPMNFKCYDVIINHREELALISVWEDSKIAVLDLNTLTVSEYISVGHHPSEMIITNDDKYLYVTNTNTNSTSCIDLQTHKEIEKLITSIDSKAPFGSTPNSISFFDNETKILIANADNNNLCVFDISSKGNSKSLGFVPVGWYPTSVKYLSHSDVILVTNGKGITSKGNPRGPNPELKKTNYKVEHINSLLGGTISFIKTPTENELKDLTIKAINNTPYIKQHSSINNFQDIIPYRHEGKKSNSIKHVFFIIKENRTYDQVYGDLPQGNGDSSLCIFNDKITPNQHLLAKTFTLFDNFYVDAEVSADGHNWSTAAYASDYVEKTWPVYYGGRGGSYDYEGGVPIAAPSSGYIWNNLSKSGVSIRNYGEFVTRDKNRTNYYCKDDYLNNFTNPDYPGFDMSISDLTRFEVWSREFDNFEKSGSFPQFSIMRLPNNHTVGTRKNELTPKAFVAQNDYALGLIVEKISKSSIWKSSMIYVIEDDAQNGSDHIDAHRSCLLVIGPYINRGYVDNTLYSTSSVLKTIELIFGAPPMTQYDFSATPILNCINVNCDTSVYNCIKPHIDITEKNLGHEFGSERSENYSFQDEDSNPDIEFNEIIWKSVRGYDSEMPAPVRCCYITPKDKEDDD